MHLDLMLACLHLYTLPRYMYNNTCHVHVALAPVVLKMYVDLDI